MRVVWITFIIGLVLFGFANWAMADNETIRPTGTYDMNARWADNANAFDDSLTTSASVTSPPNIGDSDLYVGATGAIGTDAWDAPSQSWDSGTLFCTYSSDGWDGNDTFAVEVRNGADATLATLEAAIIGAVAKTTKSYVLTGGELADQTDLRCVGIYNRTGGQDSGSSDIFEVWQDGTFTVAEGGRRRSVF